jgi:hypothetical protein
MSPSTFWSGGSDGWFLGSTTRCIRANSLACVVSFFLVQIILKVKTYYSLMLLSIDCGIKNLALCLIDPTTRRIHQWDVSGVPPKHADGVFPCLVGHLNTKPWVLEATTVIIEKQPDRNRGMKAVENLLHAYFLIKEGGRQVVIWDARHKIPDVAGAGKTRYAQRKKTSIERARKFIAESSLNRDWVQFFDGHKKKDDLADTVMQALSFIDKRPVNEEQAKPKVQKPRKPTENQVRTKYSKANLAWLVKTGAKQDARFKKDLGRYYKDVKELQDEFCL